MWWSKLASIKDPIYGSYIKNLHTVSSTVSYLFTKLNILSCKIESIKKTVEEQYQSFMIFVNAM